MLVLVLTVLGLGADLGSKTWAFGTVASQPVQLDRADLLDRPEANPIPTHEGLRVLPGGLLDFRLVLNSGAVFGLGAQHRGLLIAFTLLAVGIALWIFGWKTAATSRLAHVGIALVLAGALGNLWDRLLYGRVRDFLHMLPDWHLPFGLHWPGGSAEIWPWIFNVADVLLLAGLGLILLHMHLMDRAAGKAKAAAKVASKPAAQDGA
jgi:signal peptidase II